MKSHIYEIRPRKDRRGVDLISDALPFGRLWYDGPKGFIHPKRERKTGGRSLQRLVRRII
jgi:hypothetical protein